MNSEVRGCASTFLRNLTSYIETFGIQGPESYVYTSRSNCLTVPGIDDVADYAETIVSHIISDQSVI